jgi:hypothetical protein
MHFKAWKARNQGLEKLGFPWILSFETSLFNGLRWNFRWKKFPTPFSAIRRAGTRTSKFGREKRGIAHGDQLNSVSAFLQ